ncbi:MAG TPA: 2-C-methyl-D-erythritol 4-phosphate cytidylyltransferase [Clostridia bacterium]|nr:2-C-methyl-D-erythritol 4-phosphate cytidylyltransferase [Clostridia bacterium]
MKVIVIIPAAGLGTRMGSASATVQGKRRSKQFVELNGSPILVHTLRKFDRCDRVDEIWVAMRRAEIEAFTPELERAGLRKTIHTVEGGEHRQQSVANALRAVEAAEDDVILVHDAVRPFIDSETIAGIIGGVEKYGAAIAGVPAIDTIKQVERTADGALIRTTIPREQIVQAQTPQGARYGLLRQAFDEAELDGFLGTDEASLLERSGQPIHVVMGSPRNIKITTPADLELAEFFLSQERRKDAPPNSD